MHRLTDICIPDVKQHDKIQLPLELYFNDLCLWKHVNLQIYQK
jgi:hypothetical protein